MVLFFAVKFVFIWRHRSSSRDYYDAWAAVYQLCYYARPFCDASGMLANDTFMDKLALELLMDV